MSINDKLIDSKTVGKLLITIGVGTGLLRNCYEVVKGFNADIQNNASWLQESFGSMGYRTLEIGVPAITCIGCLALTAIGTYATGKYLFNSEPKRNPL